VVSITVTRKELISTFPAESLAEQFITVAEIAKSEPEIGSHETGTGPFTMLEVIEDRSKRASTLIASQLPPTAWHAAIGEPSVADAICDRLIHRAHRLTLNGPTMRDSDTWRGGKAK
jgi:IstB-like ATP binding protein